MRIPLVFALVSALEGLLGANPPPEYPPPIMTYQGETQKPKNPTTFVAGKPDVEEITQLVREIIAEQTRIDKLKEQMADHHDRGG